MMAPSPIADYIERAAVAMTSPRMRHDREYAAEWSMILLECATQVRTMEAPTAPKRRRYLPTLFGKAAAAIAFVLIR